MNLYKVSQSINNKYDTYDAIIVVAPSAKAAKQTPPDEYCTPNGGWGVWAPIEHLEVEYLGVAAKSLPEGLVLASFNAG